MHCDLMCLQPSHPEPSGDVLAPAVADALATLDQLTPLTVLVNDPYRHTDSAAVLLEIARHVDPAAIRLLVATGAHEAPAAERADFEKMLRGDLPIRQVSWHDCRSPQLVPIGPDIWLGHPWLLDRGGLLAVGSVEPHYVAGFTGAHKTATIGCAGFEDIRANHARATDARCRPCRLTDNPVFAGIECMLAALTETRAVAAVNVVQLQRTIVAAAGGGPLRALKAAGLSAMRAFARRIDAPADAVVAEVTGPLGRSLYQAEKGIKNNERAVRDGGAMVLVAPCPEGIGQPGEPAGQHFAELLAETRTYRQALRHIEERGYRLGDHKAVRLRRLTDPAERNVRVVIVSSRLGPAELKPLGLEAAESVEAALTLVGGAPEHDRVYRLRDAGNLCVLLEEDFADLRAEI